MVAAHPLRLLVAGLTAVFGCQWSGGTVPVTARGQIGSDPIAPLSPASLPPPDPRLAVPSPSFDPPAADPSANGPPAGGSPIPGSPVPGLPVPNPDRGSAPVPPVQTVGYTAAIASGVPRIADLLKESVPQIKVVALVGASNLVTDQEVLEAVRQRLGELRGYVGPARAVKERELYRVELRRIIERELILDEMFGRLKKAGRTAVLDEIKEFAAKATDLNLRAIRKASGVTTEEEFVAVLRSQGLTLPVIRRQMERQLMADEFVRSMFKEKGRTPGLADIRAYYERNPELFRSEDRVKWLDIFISFNRHPSPQAAYEHAEAVRRQAVAGADFVALVKQYDDGLARGSDGVGVGSKRGEILPVDVEPVVWSLKPGEVGPLVETPAGYHVIKVVEREYAGLRPFDAKVQAEIRETLLRQYRELEYQRLVEDLWRNGSVHVIDPSER